MYSCCRRLQWTVQLYLYAIIWLMVNIICNDRTQHDAHNYLNPHSRSLTPEQLQTTINSIVTYAISALLPLLVLFGASQITFMSESCL
ncbi:hypothetical protein PHMEG_0009917 [Phytophthora megakarya]|uniref:Uncharacterized protein n=1 Tax=Phytophthora megakarya TaxID=4795 RepID=A0A225WH19_9STRA|nr:hypothetical protein PHMEG_0009917 [Phytophthora megakarya]